MIKNLLIVNRETDVLLGLVESNSRNVSPISLLSLDETRRIANNYLKDLDKHIKERIIDFETEDYKVKELITKLELKKEGAELKHCVAGYGESIKRGESIIIQFIPKNKNGTRCTMELSPSIKQHPLSVFGKKLNVIKSNYFIYQIRGKSNESVVLDTSLYEAFEKINSSLAFLPLSYVTHMSFKDISKDVRSKFSRSIPLNNRGNIIKQIISNKTMFNFGTFLSKGFPGFQKNKKNNREIFSLVWKYNKYTSAVSSFLLNPLVSYECDKVEEYFYNTINIKKLNYQEFLEIDDFFKYYNPPIKKSENLNDFIPEIYVENEIIGNIEENVIPF
jgi:hypothetical protein